MTADVASLAGEDSLSTRISMPLSSFGGRCGGEEEEAGLLVSEEHRGSETLKRRRCVRNGEGAGSKREGWV